jgi:hypothetical protein
MVPFRRKFVTPREFREILLSGKLSRLAKR